MKGGNKVPQNDIVLLLRQISSSLPGDAETIPDELSGLSFPQIYLLGELFDLERTGHEPVSLSALSKAIGFSKATICTTLKKLRQGGLIQVQTDAADNRRKEITLTQQARNREPCVTQYIAALDRTLCAGISSQDLQTMEQSLQMILRNTKKTESSAFE